MSPVKLRKEPMSYVFIAKEWPCPLLIIRNATVACHYIFKASRSVVKPPCRISNLRKGHVAMSNLVVQTHITVCVIRHTPNDLSMTLT